MMTVIELKNKNCNERIGFRVFCKGASEILLNRCKFFVGSDGNVEEFKIDCKENLLRQVIQKMAEDGLRTITIGYKDYIFDHARSSTDSEVRFLNKLDNSLSNLKKYFWSQRFIYLNF